MRVEVPEAAGELAGQLVEAFATDRALAEQQTAAQDRLRAANGQLWSGLHPDGLGLLYDNAAVVVGQGASAIAERMLDALYAGLPVAEVQAAVLPGLQEAHWVMHRAFGDYQAVSEDRRHLAGEIGELIAGLVSELVGAGWSDEQARNADVRQLAAAATPR